MFDPDDKKQTPRRRSLLDLAAVAQEPRQQAAARASVERSLLDRLGEPRKEQGPRKGPRVSIKTSGLPVAGPVQPVRKPGLKQRISSWISKTAKDVDAGQEPARIPSDASSGMRLERSAVSDDGRPREDRPLIDLGLVLRSVWRVRLLILLLTILGAIGGVMLAIATPNKYVSESRLYADPREVRLTDSDLSNQTLATEAILAIIDSQMQVLTSGKVLEKVSTELGLERDPEFSGRSAAGTGFGVIRELIFGRKTAGAASNGAQIVLEKLRDAVSVSRDEKTFIIAVRVTTHDAAKSALVANKLVATFLEEESNAQSGFFKRTTTALDERIAELRKELDLAETAVEKYKADNDIVGASGKLISENQLVTLNDQVGAAVNRVAEARAKADTLAGVRLNDVLSGASPEDVNSLTLTELRKQYATASAEFGALSSRLGPRHPQRVAAEQALSATRTEVQNELRRIAASARTEFQRAVETQADLARQLAVQKTRQVNSAGDFVKLRELERTANATRVIYESFLKRALETGEEQKLTSRNIRVISQAAPALQPSGPSRKIIAVGVMMAGLFAGIGIGVLLGIYRSLVGASQAASRSSEFVYVDEPTDQPPGGNSRRNTNQEQSRTTPASGNWQSASSGYGPARGMHHDDRASTAFNDLSPSAKSASDISQELQAYGQWSEAAARLPDETVSAVADSDEGMRRVQDDLRSLRERVENYNRQNRRARF